MIKGVTFSKVDAIRHTLHTARQRTSDPVLIEALTDAVDELDDVLIAIVRDDAKDESAPKPVPVIPSAEQRAETLHQNIVDIMLHVARGPFMEVIA